MPQTRPREPGRSLQYLFWSGWLSWWHVLKKGCLPDRRRPIWLRSHFDEQYIGTVIVHCNIFLAMQRRSVGRNSRKAYSAPPRDKGWRISAQYALRAIAPYATLGSSRLWRRGPSWCRWPCPARPPPPSAAEEIP